MMWINYKCKKLKLVAPTIQGSKTAPGALLIAPVTTGHARSLIPVGLAVDQRTSIFYHQTIPTYTKACFTFKFLIVLIFYVLLFALCFIFLRTFSFSWCLKET